MRRINPLKESIRVRQGQDSDIHPGIVSTRGELNRRRTAPFMIDVLEGKDDEQ
jgi:hypothetical protein